MQVFLKILRRLPYFKGKYKIAELLAKNILNKRKVISFKGKYNLSYTIPNTIETVGKELIINGVYELSTIKLIKKIIPNNAIFFDIGGNIGSITLPIANKITTNVHSFEPSKLSFKFLEKNVEQNKFKNVTLNNIAVHSEDGKDLIFYEAEDKYGNSSLSATYSQQTHYSVSTIALDAYCKRNGISKIDVLKVDVQGYELDVLQGAKELIKSNAICYIIFEMESWAEAQAGHEVGASQKYLLENGYSLFDLEGRKINMAIISESAMFLAVSSNSLIPIGFK